MIFKSDMLASTFVAALLLVQVGYSRRPSVARAMLMGALVAASTATKYHGAFTLIVPLLAIPLAPWGAHESG